jgi:hypothetical protein
MKTISRKTRANQAVKEKRAPRNEECSRFTLLQEKDYRNFTALLRWTIDAEWLLDYDRRHA